MYCVEVIEYPEGEKIEIDWDWEDFISDISAIEQERIYTYL